MIQSQSHDCYDAIPTWSKDKCLEELSSSDTTLKTAYGDKNRKITAGVVRSAILVQLQAALASEQQRFAPMTALTSTSLESSSLVELINLQKYLIELCCPGFVRHPPIMQAASITFNDQIKSLLQHNLQLLSLNQQQQQNGSNNNQANINTQPLELRTVPPLPQQPASTLQTQQSSDSDSHQSKPKKSILKKKQVQFQDAVQQHEKVDDEATQWDPMNAALAAIAQPTTGQCRSSASTQSVIPGYAEEDRILTGDEGSSSDEDEINNNNAPSSWDNNASHVNGTAPQQVYYSNNPLTGNINPQLEQQLKAWRQQQASNE